MWSLYFVVNQRFTFLYIALRQKIIAKVSLCDKKLSLKSKVNKVKKRKEKKYIKKIIVIVRINSFFWFFSFLSREWEAEARAKSKEIKVRER